MESRVATPRTLLAARQRMVGKGGLEGVPDPILRSWERCAALGLDFGTRPRVEPVTERELREACERNEALRRRCRPEIEALHADAQATDSLVILTDAEGLVLDTLGSTTFAGRAAQVALRPGVPWNEAATGTNAIGTALVERRPVEVRGAEHYFEPHRILSCAAMPILGSRGETLGALDLSGPAAVHHMHALGLIRLAVDAIEHRLFDAVASDRAVLRLHADPALLGTPREGVLVFDGARLVGANRAGLALLGLDWSAIDRADLDRLFPDLRAPVPGPLQLRDGAGRLLHGRLQAEPARPRPRPGRAPAVPAGPDAPVFDAATADLLARAVRLLDAGIAVVVEGETGTGKEVFSRAVHAACARARAPFVAVNCAALPESLIEAELFGYEPGAFTGAAKHGAKGLLRQADGGLLFLDEIGDMPLALQSRLLRVLQEREVQPVGGGRPVPVDFALICATHRDLGQLVAEGRFRADLFYRIAPYRVTLAPLRARADRREVVQRLWEHLGGAARGIALAPACAALLAEAEWPGNFRQLVGTLRALLALADPGDVVGPERLPDTLRVRPPALPAAPPAPAALAAPAPSAAAESLDAIARDAMRAALDAAGGNVSEAARRLGISRSTLYRRCLSERA
ncbi:GAF modulated sigma54 specific transcriptional regulator, Fis family [Methylobacterium sp. 4-46]|uniref:sigma-54-dependent Fis family transcriptional regulator n=1 Tax=unclassified Methylobacterium TaxID=2615210 RepID=UPI000152E12F|nr:MULTISPECIES: sigma-54-dependent Fis family transcriptional regulator [Methylobacterium]ACA21059.1 GAF modulated sigma54 specific transcriptional regulator, Fis family [Methylobacterium sp. 4-46]WFT80208.1 sigma-54-dependent Fis family transcriptional regulator [Methylobacterium nodulans]